MPFGIGKRSCIGQNFALLEAKVIVAMLIRRYDFTLSPGQKIVPESTFTLRPKYGISMRVSRH